MPAIMTFLSSLDWQHWAIIGIVIYMVITKKIDVGALWQWITNNPTPPTPPTPVPPGPTPIPTPAPTPSPFPNIPTTLPALLQFLLQILLKSKASGDKETEAAVLKLMSAVDQPMAAAMLGKGP